MNYTTLANNEAISKTVTALKEHGIETIVVENKADALEKIKELIPKDASVMNGSSTTLQQIGFIEYLKSGTHGWNNLHEAIVAETDPQKQKTLRNQSVVSDYYLGSIHALVESGEFLIGSNSGSQLPHIVYTSPNLIFVVGTHKIVSSLEKGFQRLEEYVVPLEDKRMQEAYGGGTMLSKVLLFKRENSMMGRKVQIILVKEVLGF